MDNRQRRYRTLVSARKACRLCSQSGLANAAEISDGAFDSDQIGPWSRSLGDLNARVMVVGQDWGDQRAFEAQRGEDWPTSATNRMLRALMAHAGIAASEGSSGTSGVFLTNAVLCFRRNGGCQGPVQSAWFQNCGTRFLRPLIELVAPVAVVCMGQRAHTAVLAAYDLRSPLNWRDAVEGNGTPLPNGPTVFAVYHCGRRILNTHRKPSAQIEDWKRIGIALRGVAHRLDTRGAGSPR